MIIVKTFEEGSCRKVEELPSIMPEHRRQIGISTKKKEILVGIGGEKFLILELFTRRTNYRVK